MRGALAAVLAAVVLAAAPAAASAAEGARRSLDEGLALFAAGSYEDAARRFAQAADGAPGAGLDAAVARFDQGCALLRAGRHAEAAAAFAQAASSPDRSVAAGAHYNRGLALAGAADAPEAAGRLEEAVALLGQALGSFEGSMQADPADEDAKVNHEVIARRKARLEERLRREQGRGAGAGAANPPPVAGARERPQPAAGREMQADEARTMLDAMRQQETSQRGRVLPQPRGTAGVEKPW